MAECRIIYFIGDLDPSLQADLENKAIYETSGKYKGLMYTQVETIHPREFAIVFGAWVHEDHLLTDVTHFSTGSSNPQSRGYPKTGVRARRARTPIFGPALFIS